MAELTSEEEIAYLTLILTALVLREAANTVHIPIVLLRAASAGLLHMNTVTEGGSFGNKAEGLILSISPKLEEPDGA